MMKTAFFTHPSKQAIIRDPPVLLAELKPPVVPQPEASHKQSLGQKKRPFKRPAVT